MKIEDIEALTGVRVLPGSKPEQTSKIPAWLDEAFGADPELAEAWQGLGKRSGAVCDRIVVQRLISTRTDEEIVSALRWRPGRFFLPDHHADMSRELAEARKMIREERKKIGNAVKCTHMIVYQQDPPQYLATVEVGGKSWEVRLNASHLLNGPAFKRRVLEVCGHIVEVPVKRSEWEDLARGWLATAEVVSVDLPEDAYILGEIEAEIAGWVRLDAAEAHDHDLRRGCVVIDEEEGWTAVHMAPIRERLRMMALDHSPSATAVLMRRLGWESRQIRVQGVKIRAWVRGTLL